MVSPGMESAARILIIEPDRRFCANLRAYTVTAFKDAAVQSVGSRLELVARDRERLTAFDVVIAACNFEADGTSSHPALKAIRAMRGDPAAPAIVLLAEHGGEYSAVQALKSGAFDYLVKKHASRELIVSSVGEALNSRRRRPRAGESEASVEIFGYEIGRRLAQNEDVSVHLAFSAERNEDVVIKVLHRGRGSLARDVQFKRFIDEFKILNDIDDPGVAEIFDFRVTDCLCYIAMEYFREGHLGTRLNRQPPDLAEALRLGAEIAQALAIVHTAGVVHRDLKPGNIMCREDGSIALIDFGISQSSSLPSTDLTGASPIIAGTPYYMSPEQIEGRPTDERTDLYSLGIILFQMLTGNRPYVGNSFDEITAQHTDPSVPQLPTELSAYQDIIDRLLAPNIDDRLGNARELAERLEYFRDSATHGHEDADVSENQALASAG